MQRTKKEENEGDYGTCTYTQVDYVVQKAAHPLAHFGSFATTGPDRFASDVLRIIGAPSFQ